MIRVLYIVPYPPEGASNRFRVLQFLPRLEQAGITGRVRPFYNRALWSILYERGCHLRKFFYGIFCSFNRLLDILRSLPYDIVFIHRESFPVGPAWFEKLLGAMGKPYIYDFDDAVFLPNVAAPNRLFGALKLPGKTASVIRGSRLTIAGNSYLADYARDCGAAEVEVLPTVVDTEVFVPASGRSERGAVTIGWIGSPTTIGFLEQFLPVLRRVGDCCDGQARFVAVGGRLGGPRTDPVETLPWKRDREIALLQGFDIGIMPMPDSAWTRGKCAFKAIEYMSVGIPAVCSPVGMNLELIEDGVNGFLPRDEDEWVEVLCRLVRDARLRSRIGLAGRKLVEQRYSLNYAAPRLEEMIRRAVEQ